jgi:serine/threonine protein phosphatase PrpC
MRVHGYGLSDVGNERTNNEDSLLIDETLGLYIVADGMGGHAGGEVASGSAVASISRYLHQRDITSLLGQEEPDLEALVRVCEEGVQAACRNVWELATSGKGPAGMGTTLTMLLFAGTKGVMIHVGDSRLYLVRAGQLHQMSDDHTFTAELIRNGVFSEKQAVQSPYAHILTRALGKSESVQVDALTFDVLPGDSFLLSSDGLTTYVDDSELVSYLGADDIRSLPQRFVDIALERGGEDNITVIVARAEEGATTLEQQVYCTKVQYQFETMQKVALLRELSMTGLMHLMDISEERAYQAGELIVEEGRPCLCVYIVLEGALAVIRDGFHLASLGPGEYAGVSSCLRPRASQASLKASRVSRCLVIEHAALQRLVRKEPRIGVTILRNFGEELSDRLRDTASILMATEPFCDAVDETPSILLLP